MIIYISSLALIISKCYNPVTRTSPQEHAMHSVYFVLSLYEMHEMSECLVGYIHLSAYFISETTDWFPIKYFICDLYLLP
jgi:hypothetical protein